MDCTTLQNGWQRYLDGQVSTAERAAMEQHLNECQLCEAIPVLDARLTRLLQERLPREKAPAALRARILSAIQADAVPGSESPTASVPTAKSASGKAPPGSWIRDLFASGWAPGLVMAAVVLLVLLMPIRSLFRAPAMAVEALDRYERHVQATSTEVPSCCHPLALRPGDLLGEPSQGASVPDLSADGLEFVMAGRCDDQGMPVTVLAYRSKQDETFFLYITDRARENFQAARSKEVGGFRQVRHQVNRSEVTIWKSAGLVWYWIGPYANPEYSTALADLSTL